MSTLPRLTFRTASAIFPKGAWVNWQKRVELRSRPDQEGADVVVFEKTPRAFVINAVLHGSSVQNVTVQRARWEDEAGRVGTLHATDPLNMGGEGVLLRDARPTTQIRRHITASDGSSFQQSIQLTFARVQAESEEG